MTEQINYPKVYDFYKVTVNDENEKDLIADCPFCDSDSKFSIHKTKGTFRCFKCETLGNIFTFYTELHSKFAQRTTKEDLLKLAKARGIPSKVLKTAQFAYDPDWERWLIPYQNGSDFLNNLGVCYPNTKGGYRILKSPKVEDLKFYRPFDKKKLKNDLWIFEGEWDLLAAYAALVDSAVKVKPSLVSTSGASTWTPAMNKSASGCNAVFFWDNDDAGQEIGPESIKKRIKGVTYSFVNWDSLELSPEANIKDVRDLWTTHRERSVDVYEELVTLSLSNASEIIGKAEEAKTGFFTNIDEITPVTTYEEYCARRGEPLPGYTMYFNEEMRMSYDILMATALSVYLPDKPIWTFLIGQASTGKSVAIESFGGSSEYFEYTSKLTAESFVSGFKGEGEISLLADIIGKCLFIGDLTVILNMPPQVQEKLWGILREAYGGTLKIPFGNQKAKEFHGYKFCMVAGVTHAIYTHNDSDMGERFIKIDYVGRDFDEDAHMDAAFRNQSRWPEIKDKLRDTVVGYYKHLKETIDFSSPPEIDKEIEAKIKSLAKLTTKLRTKVQKDRFEGMISRPVSESPTRFGTQLNTIAKTLIWVCQTDHVTPYIYRCLKKIAFDSCPGLGLETVLNIHKKKECTVKSLHHDLHIPKTRLQQITSDFKALGILENTEVNNGSGARGRNVHRFSLSPMIEASLNDVVESRFATRPKSKPLRKFTTIPKRRAVNV